MAVFWYAEPYSVVEIDWRFGGASEVLRTLDIFKICEKRGDGTPFN
jgi:hypothetical protein